MPRAPKFKLVPIRTRPGTFSLKKNRGKLKGQTVGTVAKFRRYPGPIKLGIMGNKDDDTWKAIKIRKMK